MTKKKIKNESSKEKREKIPHLAPDDPNGHQDYFDDCPICQAMKKMGIKSQRVSDEEPIEGNIFEDGFEVAKISEKEMKELKEAFKKAKDQGAMVGGKWLEEDDDDDEE